MSKKLTHCIWHPKIASPSGKTTSNLVKRPALGSAFFCDLALLIRALLSHFSHRQDHERKSPSGEITAAESVTRLKGIAEGGAKLVGSSAP